MLHIDPKSATPIWSQIEDGVRQLVARGQLVAGRAVPSVRMLAKELRVNPATVSKAYRRLTDRGVLEVRRGEGTFVSSHPPDLPPEQLQERLLGAAQTYAGVAITLGVSPAEAIQRLREAYDEIQDLHEVSS